MQVEHAKGAAKPKVTQPRYQRFDYASMRNLRGEEQDPADVEMLPGLGSRLGRQSFMRPKPIKQPPVVQEPRLLSSAIKQIRQEFEEAKSEMESSNYLGMNSFYQSREPTPSNPLLASKKRSGVNRNKVNSIATELYDIQSNPEEQQSIPKHRHPDFRLHNNILGQSEAVHRYVFGHERVVDPNLVNNWKDCLSHEDKSEIFIPVGEERVEVPYTNSRIYQLNQIDKQFKSIYGSGKNRSLSVGEEAIIIEGIQKYMKVCSGNPVKIGRKDYDILQDVLSDCKMPELENYPMCMRQIEAHFKIIATRWRYSGQLNLKDRLVESGLAMGKNNFLDLGKENPLTAYLLANSNISEL